jgi:hypothetical protein
MLTDFVGVGVRAVEYEFVNGIITDTGGIDENASHKGDIFVREV